MAKIIGKVKEYFGKSKTELHTKNDTPEKIYVGNARLDSIHGSMTLNMTEILNNKSAFRIAEINGEEITFLNLTVLPFKKGKNRFGNTHYLIIKNQ
jgi:hypothetical protein